jgi:hypothetical protein
MQPYSFSAAPVSSQQGRHTETQRG